MKYTRKYTENFNTVKLEEVAWKVKELDGWSGWV